MEISDEMQDKIKSIWDISVDEGVSGRLFCTNSGLIKIAKVLGIDYKIMGKEKRRNFRSDVICGYQSGFFKKYHNY